jgi:C4-dicarboxylate-specific signal transduction histidine kinase
MQGARVTSLDGLLRDRPLAFREVANAAAVPDDLLGALLDDLTSALGGSPTAPVHVIIDGSGDAPRVSERNQGPVIPPESVPVLFEPFHRGVRTATQPRGLGLYISREIVRAHEGIVEVDSTDDRGTIFSVSIPRGRRGGS